MSCESFDRVQQICARSKAMIGEVLSGVHQFDYDMYTLLQISESCPIPKGKNNIQQLIHHNALSSVGLISRGMTF